MSAREDPPGDARHPHGRSVDPAFRADVLAGLARSPKAIPARWFYDQAGSELFEGITALPEYYPTRSETALLRAHAAEVAGMVGPRASVVELGSGSSTKTPILLGALRPAAYVPVDISGAMLRASAATIAAAFPTIRVDPVEADFMGDWRLPPSPGGVRAGDDAGAGAGAGVDVGAGAGAVLGFFPGSTIGNFGPGAAVDLLRGFAQRLAGGAARADSAARTPGAADPWLLIGIDTVKDAGVLRAAYDDAAGVTAAFNRNLAMRINRELAGTLPVDALSHRAVWNEAAARIEMHLVATRPIAFTVEGERFAMAEGEHIHTENSHKYTPSAARTLLAAGGWSTVAQWVEPEPGFQLILARATPPAPAP